MGDHEARQVSEETLTSEQEAAEQKARLEAGRLLFAKECEFAVGTATLDRLPVADLPEVAFAGRSNVGKSSLINALTDQRVSIVSSAPGTTTDPVQKSFEMEPVGPVVFVDTAGVDDEGELGQLRMQRSAELLTIVIANMEHDFDCRGGGCPP